MTRDELFKSAMELEDADRFRLAMELLETVPDDVDVDPPDIDPEAIAEWERRENDGSPRIPWEQVQAQLRADLRRE